MLRRFSVDFALFSMLIDALLVAGALKLSILVRPFIGFIPFAVDFKGPFNIPNELYPIFSLSWVVVLLLFSVYDTRRNFRVVDELTSLTLGSFFSTITLAGYMYLSYRDVSRALFLVFALIAYLLLVSIRVAFRLNYRVGQMSGIQQRRVLIIGAGVVGREMEKTIREHQTLGLDLVGFLDDDAQKRTECVDILGVLDDARSTVKREKIDDVIFALPRRAFELANKLVAELHDLPVKVWVIPDYFALALNRASVEEFAGIPMIDLRAPALNDYQRMLKRVFDIGISLLLMPVALPIIAVLALAIRLDTPGPSFFLQKRVGENGRLFNMIKFRSMVSNAEELRYLVEKVGQDGKIIQNKNGEDPRVTRVGRFIRRTSLDELPQIFNVLKGEMSLVGPRPELPYMVEKYEPWQRRRFAVPQGITGWWQVNGRSDKPMYQHTDEDIYYVQNYSIWLDIQIMLKTVWVVLRRKGAY